MIPGSANSLLLATAAAPTGYNIERSVRFNSADSAYLSRTPASAGNRKTWTWAGWVKRSKITSGDYQFIFGYASGSTYEGLLWVAGSDKLEFWSNPSAPIIQTTRLFRDPSAWFHIVLACDSTQATASNRVKLYINGAQVTQLDAANYPTQDFLFKINDTIAYNIGSEKPDYGRYFDGYLADVHFIDGQALDPTSFGEFDTNGVWQPKAYTGTYGTNGFHLPFSDNSTAAALGTDSSGNGNTWTVNNISVAAGSGNDSLVDSPTNYGTDTGAGGEVRGNYCTWNPLDLVSTSLANGNLQASGSANVGGVSGTIGVSSGKWYWEITAGSEADTIGLWSVNSRVTTYPGGTADSYCYFGTTGATYNNSTFASYGDTFTANDTIGVALNLDAGTLTFFKNNISQGVAFSGLTGGFRPAVRAGNAGKPSTATYANFGQRPFAYTAPSGYKALCTQNLPTPTIADGSSAMDVVLDTGANILTAAQGAIGGSADLLWIKDRANTNNHQLIDTVRGGTATLQSNTIATETTYSAPSGSSVAWTWDAGSSTVTNTDGSITSQVRANPSAGFSIVQFTSQASGAATVGHGLGVAPQFIIQKIYNVANSWLVYHQSLGNTQYVFLNLTNAAASSSTAWNNTSPTSTVYSVGSSGAGGYSMISYCFAPVAGYSSFGSYTGNGSADGPFVYTGFRPRWVMIKESSASGNNWNIWDAARDDYNVTTKQLKASSSDAEATNTFADFTSNGFKIRVSTSGINTSSATYIYAAFAENPFQAARAR